MAPVLSPSEASAAMASIAAQTGVSTGDDLFSPESAHDRVDGPVVPFEMWKEIRRTGVPLSDFAIIITDGDKRYRIPATKVAYYQGQGYTAL